MNSSPTTQAAMTPLQIAYSKLQQIRKRTDLKLKKTPLLRDTITLPDGREVPSALRYYQIQGVLHLCVMDRFLLGDDTGIGKTIQAITALCHLWALEPNVKAIILTDKSVVAQWAAEFAKFCHVDQMCILQCVGDSKKREKIYEKFRTSTKPTAMILTYAMARQDVDILRMFEGYSFICDEAAAFKETKTQCYKTVWHMAQKCRRMWAMTATLLKNRLTEGYGIYSVLMPGLFDKSKTKFIEEYCITRMQQIPGSRRQFPIILGYRQSMVPVFRDKIDPFYLGRAKMDVAQDLPPLTMREHYVDMSPAQRAKYAETVQGFLYREKTAEEKEVEPLTAVLYCQQIVDHLELVDCSGPSAKFDALFELLEVGDFAEEKIIVFSRFEKMISLIEAEAKRRKISVVRITGKENDKQRTAAQESFMSPEGARLCLITQAAEQGINLQSAKAIIFYDTPWSAGSFLQTIGRMIRIGSTHTHCYAIHMVTRKSVDTRVMQVLKQKYALLEQVLGRRIKGAEDGDMVVSDRNDISEIYKSLLTEFQT